MQHSGGLCRALTCPPAGRASHPALPKDGILAGVTPDASFVLSCSGTMWLAGCLGIQK
jgi:hypothetical protein